MSASIRPLQAPDLLGQAPLDQAQSDPARSDRDRLDRDPSAPAASGSAGDS